MPQPRARVPEQPSRGVQRARRIRQDEHIRELEARPHGQRLDIPDRAFLEVEGGFALRDVRQHEEVVGEDHAGHTEEDEGAGGVRGAGGVHGARYEAGEHAYEAVEDPDVGGEAPADYVRELYC